MEIDHKINWEVTWTASAKEYDQDQTEVTLKTAMVNAGGASVRHLEDLSAFARLLQPRR